MLEGTPELNDDEDVDQYTRNAAMRKKNKAMHEAA
jgi:hypothetical protein